MPILGAKLEITSLGWIDSDPTLNSRTISIESAFKRICWRYNSLWDVELATPSLERVTRSLAGLCGTMLLQLADGLINVGHVQILWLQVIKVVVDREQRPIKDRARSGNPQIILPHCTRANPRWERI